MLSISSFIYIIGYGYRTERKGDWTVMFTLGDYMFFFLIQLHPIVRLNFV